RPSGRLGCDSFGRGIRQAGCVHSRRTVRRRTGQARRRRSALIEQGRRVSGEVRQRSHIRIPAGQGEEIDAWLYLPDGRGPHPVVVMAHGIGGVKAAGLAPFAERFADGGFAALVFDYRHWGGSTGEPRQLLSIRRQLADYRTALAWTHADDRSDSTRIFLWGTSFAGHAYRRTCGKRTQPGRRHCTMPTGGRPRRSREDPIASRASA